jgi:hypothetical protein
MRIIKQIMENTNAIATSDQFQHTQRVAKALSASALVPQAYQGDAGMANCIVAIMVAQRVGIDPFTVMQNMDVINGRPSWKSSYIISAVNSSGRFAPLRFETDDKQGGRCRAWTVDKSGERLNGPWVSMEMAAAEGWTTRKGSKWATMPELMLNYRAAAFFGRLYAPDILNGMQTAEEVIDAPESYKRESEAVQALNDIAAREVVVPVAVPTQPVTVPTQPTTEPKPATDDEDEEELL